MLPRSSSELSFFVPPSLRGESWGPRPSDNPTVTSKTMNLTTLTETTSYLIQKYIITSKSGSTNDSSRGGEYQQLISHLEAFRGQDRWSFFGKTNNLLLSLLICHMASSALFRREICLAVFVSLRDKCVFGQERDITLDYGSGLANCRHSASTQRYLLKNNASRLL